MNDPDFNWLNKNYNSVSIIYYLKILKKYWKMKILDMGINWLFNLDYLIDH